MENEDPEREKQDPDGKVSELVNKAVELLVEGGIPEGWVVTVTALNKDAPSGTPQMMYFTSNFPQGTALSTLLRCITATFENEAMRGLDVKEKIETALKEGGPEEAMKAITELGAKVLNFGDDSEGTDAAPVPDGLDSAGGFFFRRKGGKA